MKEKIDVGFIGCGEHAWRNVLPALQFAPVNLVAICDRDKHDAQAFARQFGALNYYTDYRKMLKREKLDGVFIITGYDEGRVTHMDLAIEVMRAGCHAWVEKPPANSSDEVREAMRVSRETGKFVLVGLKKCFYPAVEKAWEISRREEFGAPSSIYVRYPIDLPSEEDRGRGESALNLFDRLPHPGSLPRHFMGPAEHVYIEDERLNGGAMVAIRFVNGAVGMLHLCAGVSDTGPLERLEVIGQGANVVVDNGVKLTYYRPGGRGGYAESASFIGADDVAPIYWEPEFSLAVHYNKGLFMQGFVGEMTYFAECVMKHMPPAKCGLDYALDLAKLYEALLRPSRQVIRLNDE